MGSQAMRRSQQGLTLLGLIAVLFVIVVLALFAMKIIPSLLEFRTAKTAIEIIAPTAQTPQEARRAFDNRAAIDDITTIQAKDLEITREGNQLVIAFAYRKEISLFGPVGLYIDYAANSKGGP
jgi:ABC-type Na+ efflux pump permease subunit